MDDACAILVTGAFGSGKTSVVEEMAELLEDSWPPYAAIDLDWLAWSNAPGASHDDHALMTRNLAAVAATYREAGVRRFLLAGAVADLETLEAIRAAIGLPLHVVRLTVPTPVIEERLGSAPTAGRADDLERARLWVAGGTGVDLEGDVVENTGPIRATALRVLERAGWSLHEPPVPARGDSPAADGPRGGQGGQAG